MVADIGLPGQAPFTAQVCSGTAVYNLVDGISIVRVVEPLSRAVLLVRIGSVHPDRFGSTSRLCLDDGLVTLPRPVAFAPKYRLCPHFRKCAARGNPFQTL